MNKPEPTVDTLPRRRGVVMRASGITDSYGTQYEREIGSGTLRRVGPKKTTANLTLDEPSEALKEQHLEDCQDEQCDELAREKRAEEF